MYYLIHKKMKLPYFVAMFQGEDFIINAKVNRLSAKPKMPHGFIEKVWIKCEKMEWLIDLQNQTIEHKNNAKKHCEIKNLKKNWNHREDHVEFFIDTIFGDIIVKSYKRQLITTFNKHFFKKYGDFNDCVGGLISNKKLKYLNKLKDVIIPLK